MSETRYDVGGVMQDRPFQIRRLGHFGLDFPDHAESIRFFTELLGFRVSDSFDWATRAKDPSTMEGLGHSLGYFLRYNGDHHAIAAFPKPVMDALYPNRVKRPGTIGHLAWQVGSMQEVTATGAYLDRHKVEIDRIGRDHPGSNWHAYMFDPDGHDVELFYGMEQIGWDGYSKPSAMYGHVKGLTQDPQIPEHQEVDAALAAGIDLSSGNRYHEVRPPTFCVDGILLSRPFKIVATGPVAIFVQDVERSTAFYRDILGFEVTEEVDFEGHHSVYLRCNTEHHMLALHPMALRERLGISLDTTVMSIGLRVDNYRQLRDAVGFLRAEGAKVVDDVPVELHPGIDYAAYIEDPNGHRLMLYSAIEQIGWDGKPRPAADRRPADPDPARWPASLEDGPRFAGIPFFGPWA